MIPPLQSSPTPPLSSFTQDDPVLRITCIGIAALGTLALYIALPFSFAILPTMFLVGSCFLVYHVWSDTMMPEESVRNEISQSKIQDDASEDPLDSTLFPSVAAGLINAASEISDSRMESREVVSHPLSGSEERAAVGHR